MGLSQLVKVTMFVPRSELDCTLKELVEFEWFHPIQPETLSPDHAISNLNSRIYKLFLDLDGLLKELNIKLQPGLIETVLRGYDVKKEKFTANDWADFVTQIEDEAKPVIQEISGLLQRLNDTKKSLAEDRILYSMLLMLSEFSVNLGEVSRLKRFFAVFSSCLTKDVNEIRKSLPEEIIVETAITRSQSALLIVGSKTNADRIDKTLRSFEIKPFAVPERLPQNPAEAYKVIAENIGELEAKSNEVNIDLEKALTEKRQKLLSLREASLAGFTVLNQMRKSGDLIRFAIIQGYLPSEEKREFEDKLGHRLNLFEEEGDNNDIPTLFRNRGVGRSFEKITLSQGPPTYNEFDPTPIITLVFPVFYGMMFADFGQGLVLLMVGLLLRRGDSTTKQWGMVFTASGLAATIFGLIVGEAFGVELGSIPLIGDAVHQIPLIGFLKLAEPTQSVVQQLLIGSILIGVVHITIGLVLDIANGIKDDRQELYLMKIPSLIMYVPGVFFAISFIASNYRFDKVLTPENSAPLPLLDYIYPIESYYVARITLIIVLGAVFIIVFGKTIAGLLGKHKEEEGIAMSLVLGVIESFIKLLEFLANTISYSRLGILLLVHASLMSLVKIALAGGPMGLPIAFAWNIAVMLIEGLIVYIQALRLHIYEWFTKFYSGTGTIFRKILPETDYVEIQWEKR